MNGRVSKNDEKQRKEERRIDIMSAAKILQDERTYVNEMQIYLCNLERQSQEDSEQAKEDAKKALKRTGVINSNGSAKKKIVSWE